MRNYLAHMSGFLSAYASTDEGQKIILVNISIYNFSIETKAII